MMMPFAKALIDSVNGDPVSVHVAFDTTSMLALLLGLILKILSRVMRDAVEIELENRQFI